MVQYQSPALDRVFHALAHPARREILHRLARGEHKLTDLATPLRMSFAGASKHVRVLERAKLVRRRVVGRLHLCRVESKPLADAERWLEQYRLVWVANFHRLDRLLFKMKTKRTTNKETGHD